MPVEPVAGSPWNGWPDVHGIGGRITVVHARRPSLRLVDAVGAAPLDRLLAYHAVDELRPNSGPPEIVTRFKPLSLLEPPDFGPREPRRAYLRSEPGLPAFPSLWPAKIMT